MVEKRPYFRRIPAAAEEERVWASFYRSTADPEMAAELLAHMDKDTDCRAQHPGLYLKCKQSIRHERARQERAMRYAYVVRTICRIAVLSPASLIAGVLRPVRSATMFGKDVALNICDGGMPVTPKTVRTQRPWRSSSAKAPSTAGSDRPAASSPTPVAADVAKSA